MKPISTIRTFTDEDRELAAMLMRRHICELLEAKPKNYPAIKTIYGLILDEENQDLSRRKVELAERVAELDQKPEQKSLPPVEIKRRVRIALGKETR